MITLDTITGICMIALFTIVNRNEIIDFFTGLFSRYSSARRKNRSTNDEEQREKEGKSEKEEEFE